MRAVTPIVLLVALLACGGDGGGTTEPAATLPAVPAVASVLIAAPLGPISTGGSITLVATARDQTGTALTGKSLSWSSANNAIATVAGTGVVTGVGAGSTIISATVDGKTGTTQVIVAAPAVATVAITSPEDAVVAGQAATMNVVVSDKDGAPLLGRRVTWSSTAPLVATVDGNGRVSALSPGTTTITAVCEGVSATAVVTIAAPAGSSPPTIASIAPATLAPGGAVTITGTNFLESGTNTVMVAGVAATVTSATPTELRATLPSTGLPCQSTQPVAVSVSSVGGMANTRHPLAVATPRALPVGGSFIVGSADAIGCNELTSDGTYLVSVFNGNTSPTLATRFEFRGSPGGATSSRIPSSAAALDEVAISSSTLPRPSGAAGAHEHLERVESDLALFQRVGPPRRSRSGPSFSRSSATRVPVPLIVGATTTVKYHYSSCTATSFANITARVVYVGAKSIVLEDAAGPLAGKIDADLIAMAQEFDAVSYPLLLNFGNPLALDAQTDGNERIVMLFTPRVNSQGPNLLGFMAGCDLFDPNQDPEVAASNQAEIFYARTVTDTSPTSTTLNGRSQWKRKMPAVMIHEAKHITSYAERISRSASQFEQVWLEEATAQTASELYGRAIHGNVWRGDAPYSPTLWCEARPTTPECDGGIVAMTDHFTFLTSYLRNFESKSILSGTSEDVDVYGSAWLFLRWVLDSYGGASERDFLRALVQSSTRSGTANIEAVTGKPFPQLLAEFTLMLAADNLPNVGAPFIEPSWNLPDVFAGFVELGSRPPAPLALRQSTTGTFAIGSRNLRGGGAVLLRVGTGVPGTSQILDLRSTSTTPLPTSSPVGLAVLRIQ